MNSMMGLLAAATFGLACVPRAYAADPAWPDPTGFNRLLGAYVSAEGVRYAAWSDNPTDLRALDDCVRDMAHTPVSELRQQDGSGDAELAYWINLYNAATLRLVLSQYPVESIKDIGNLITSAWERNVVKVDGELLSLNAIENEIIRKRFAEPRIHFALNCAARSCPPLRAEAFVADRLDEQLEEQTARFLSDRGSNSVDESGRLHLSKIFDWYKSDFRETSGSVPAWVKPYLPGFPDRPPDEVDWKANDYDWSLNEAPAGA